MSFIKYLKEVPGVLRILGVDIESMPLRCSSDLFAGDEYSPRRESPLQVTLFKGNAADPDYRLIGCDAVIAIEMIEHMLPHDLDRLVHNVFGFIKPWIVVITTPNGDFNVLFKSLQQNGFRRLDHFFEWSREQFNEWCSNIVFRYPNYSVTCQGVGPGPPGTLHYGCCSQLALFVNKHYHKQQDLNIDSLALVPMPNPPPSNDSENWDSTVFDNGLQTEIEGIGVPYGLNCSTLQVTKFSKASQNLMAKNKIHSVHTREVVDEIRQLTKTLKFNKCIMDRPEDGVTTWFNINWGDDAPYWNQYYKVVKEYSYPFETKSEECRILDLISEEINHLIDTQCDEATSCIKNRLEIPLTDLMSVVEHITDDINLVRDILVWNGYEIVDDIVIHSRMVVDLVSIDTHEEDWQDNASNNSDWDNTTEVQSSTVSEGSTIVPDYQDRCLRRALDHKLRNLRKMLTADEDITTELDKVVCKLMKLALRTSTKRATPPPTKWMQCKLLDLLTLTEKSIQRRTKHVMKDSLKAIKFDFVQDDSKQEMSVHEVHKNDTTNDINDNNGHVETPDLDMDIEKPLLDNASPTTMFNADILEGMKQELDSMERTKAWLDVDVGILAFRKQEINSKSYSLLDSDNNITVRHKQKKLRHKCITDKEIGTPACLASLIRTSSSKYKPKREEKKRKISSTIRVTKNVTRKISPNCNIYKNSDSKNTVYYDSYILKPKRKAKENQCLTMRASKPIPESLIELCSSEFKNALHVKKYLNEVETSNNIVVLNQSIQQAAAEESVLLDIIIDDNIKETLPLCKSTVINGEEDDIANSSNKDQRDDCSNNIDLNLYTRHEVSTEKICSNTIFLNDINEPSTSKGIRHNVSMDVQCGPDSLTGYSMSASTSLGRIPQGLSVGIKIHDGTPESVQGTEFGTCTEEFGCDKIITPRSRSIGIKIKDSDVNIFPAPFLSSMTERYTEVRNRNSGPRSWSPESNMIASDKQVSFVSTADTSYKTALKKPVSSTSNINYSTCEFCESVGSILKSSLQFDNSTVTNSESLMTKLLDSKESGIAENFSTTLNGKPTLSCGGVHVHSYKEKQEYEDIVYQGKWQRYRPKSERKKTLNTILAKKIYDSGNNRRQKEFSKEKGINKKDKPSEKNTKKMEVDVKKPLQIRNPSALQKERKETVINTKKNNVGKQFGKSAQVLSNISKHYRSATNVTKVASKIAMSSTTSKNIKFAFTAKKPQPTTTISSKKESNSQKIKKNYIPLYMRKRNLEMIETKRLNESISSVDSEENKKILKVAIKTDEIKNDLLQFQGEVTENTYLVFRNENQENRIPSNEQQIVSTATNEDSIMQTGTYIKRTRSHQSLTSSTCSSPNSIVTVRAVNMKSKNLSFRRHSGSSHKSSLNTSESDNPTPTKTKKSLKRCKTAKRIDRDTNNKENIPQTTEDFLINDSEKFVKSPFAGQPKNICVSQLKADRPSISKHKIPRTKKSNIKIPTQPDSIDKILSSNASFSRKRSRNSSVNIMVPGKDTSDGGSESFNMVFVLNPQEKVSGHESITCADDVIKGLDNNVESNNIDYIKEIVGELLNFEDQSSAINSRSVNLLDRKNEIINLNDSLNSFATVTPNYLNSTFAENIDKISLNCTLDTLLGNESIISVANTRTNVTDTDLLSFKSVTSMSKDSEYFIADSELTTAIGNVEFSQDSSTGTVRISVRDIFERKEQHLMQNPQGGLAIQGFSGFSLDGEQVTSEPDPVALVDSETGSVAMGPTRHATSEEVFISGRSSESYQCLIDEDAVVPNWLFQMINHQHSSTGVQNIPILDQQVEDLPMIGPQPAPLDQGLTYDMNGNIIEPSVIDAAAGAGDGRGIHSDQSQDSSGRDTSLSSSDTSSSAQSEPIMVEPSAYTGQIELLRDPVTSAALTANSNEEHSREEYSRTTEGTEHVVLMANNNRRMRTFSNEASDISADISSIDTDVPDSDD